MRRQRWFADLEAKIERDIYVSSRGGGEEGQRPIQWDEEIGDSPFGSPTIKGGQNFGYIQDGN